MPLLEAVIDVSLVNEVMTCVTTVVSKLFSTFPLNVFVIMSIAGGSIALFRRGKRAAR